MTFTPFVTARFCKAFVGLALCVIGCASQAREGGPMHGPHFGMQRGAQAEARGARQAERAQQRAARGGQAREMPAQRAPEMQAPVMPQEAAPQPGRPGRLTPDERRALRQQINEAGRDVYRPNRP